MGAKKAAALQQKMTESILATIDRFRRRANCAFEIHHAGGNKEDMEHWLGKDYTYVEQVHGDLGRRMFSALASHLGGYGAVILVGSDCPSIDETVLKEALEALRQSDVVIGPAYDGGYYLVGVDGRLTETSLAELFREIPWGSENVLSATLDRVQEQRLSCTMLRKLHDIDTPADLRHLDHHSDA